MTARQPTRRFLLLGVLLAHAWIAGGAMAAEPGDKRILFDFGRPEDLRRVSVTFDAKFALAKGAGGASLRVEMGHRAAWPGITLAAPGGKWDLSRHAAVEVDVRNLTAAPAKLSLRIDNPGADGRKNCLTGSIELAGRAAGTITVRFNATGILLTPPVEIVGMRGTPGGAGPFDPANVTQVLLFSPRPTQDHAVAIDNLRAVGRMAKIDSRKFFPFIDEFGQYDHADWPGKVHSEKNLKERIAVEQADLAARPGPKGWNRYGGWADGPKFKATGHFYPASHEGKWWLVDPEGRLFWSHGPDCVRAGGYTPITDRKHYFRGLPEKDTPFGRFYSGGSWAPHGYYQGKRYETYNFTGANLMRKYGAEWEDKAAESAHRRLRGWGMNTIANWSDAKIYLRRKTPYVVSVNAWSPSIEGSEGYWGKFPDVFDERFAGGLRKRMAQEAREGGTAGDPWCIGYFVGNELSWGNETSLATAALVSPPGQAAKKAFIETLKTKYQSIEKLNAAWGARYASWQALLDGREPPPDRKRAAADLQAFGRVLAETYFRICKEEVHRAAPKNLYLGCRFAWRNDPAVRAAAKHCDVVSVNLYKDDVEDFRLPEGVDRPVVIGEFHFGALDRGMFHTGLRPTKSQDDRARMYRQYVRGALRNRLFVGAHWFQYGDQATTGRGDGENYQIGLLNICDTPYPETISAVRDVGYDLYEYRLKTK